MSNWLEAIPFVEFAYNRTPHSATKLSPFQIVYGFNPLTPLDLSPLPPTEFVNADAESKAEYVKRLHQKVKENIERKTEQYEKQANKGRKKVVFQPGEWVWLHFRPERFPNKRTSKLAPRGDGPFKVLEKINDNAYRLELPGEYTVSPTFNVADLAPFDAGDTVLGSKPFQEGENDEDIQPRPPKEAVRSPFVPNQPMTRSRSRNTQHNFNMYVGHLMEQLEIMEKAQSTVHRDRTRIIALPEPSASKQPFHLKNQGADQPNLLDSLEDSPQNPERMEINQEDPAFRDDQALPDLELIASQLALTDNDQAKTEDTSSFIIFESKATNNRGETHQNALAQGEEDTWPLLAINGQVPLNTITWCPTT